MIKLQATRNGSKFEQNFVNVDVALKLSKYLSTQGFTVTLTRIRS